MNKSTDKPHQQLSNLFGNYKAEWLQEQIFDLFTKPSYFPELETFRPCVLEGGRGTGKTTVLRSLSYEGRFALSNQNRSEVAQWPYFGFYYRVDTNRVMAFRGEELSDDAWTKLFSHYLNLIFCEQVLEFLLWFRECAPTLSQVSPHDCKRIALSLNIEAECLSVDLLLAEVDIQKLKFEAYLNNLSDDTLPALSLQGSAVDVLMESVRRLTHFKDKHFFFLIDEYENFQDYQQVVLNTLIKHASQHYCFKIGVRELGWRKRNTLNANEQLISPADYMRISILEKLDESAFRSLATDICDQRLSHIELRDDIEVPSIEELLPGLSEEDEAVRLGVVARVDQELSGFDSSIRQRVKSLRPLEAWMVLFWSKTKDVPLEIALEECEAGEIAWKNRYENYRHAILFSIKKGRSGIRKYYVGWETFLLLANRNIRYLLELVDQTLVLQSRADGTQFGTPVSFETQTRAAEAVGKKNLTELEGLSVQGASLTRLILGLGRVFEVMARYPEGHAPETNQFYLAETPEMSVEFNDLLSAAVMHLALVRFSGTKLSDSSDLRDYDYSIHPIFAPFFIFSYRKKRKMQLQPRLLIGLTKEPRKTIDEILKSISHREDDDLPEQLQLFGSYYGHAK